VSHLLREHAPITAAGWDRIDQEARERLTPALAAPAYGEAAPAASNLMTETPVPASIPEAIELTRVISTTPFAVDTWATAASPVSQENSATETVTAVEEVKERGPSSAEPVVATVPEVQPVEPETKTSKESWFSVPSNPWSAEMEKANRLASAWDAAVPVAALPASSNGAEKAAGAASETTQKALEEAALMARILSPSAFRSWPVPRGRPRSRGAFVCSAVKYGRHYELTPGCRLPNVAGVLAHHFLACLAAKRFGKVRAVLQRPVGAVLAGRMRIGLGQQP